MQLVIRAARVALLAGTATRWGQRLLASITALKGKTWKQWSFDVSQAFAKGMTSEEIAKYTGQTLRAVQLEVRQDDVELIRKQPGFEDFVHDLFSNI